jgi:hypothetical protein
LKNYSLTGTTNANSQTNKIISFLSQEIEDLKKKIADMRSVETETHARVHKALEDSIDVILKT